MILRCAVAKSAEDIVITALDAVGWTNSAWQAVTQSTIRNTFRMAGFTCPDAQAATSSVSEGESDEAVEADDVSLALKNLDALLGHISIGGQSLSASEFVELDDDTPAFNEWSDGDEDLIIVDTEFGNKINNEDDDEIPTESAPKLLEAMEMVRRLHLLAATQQPQLHSLVSQLDSQLTQLFIDSKGVTQTKIDDFFARK